MGAKNTINSSLRSKNFWISIFFCMRHFIYLGNAHKKFELILAKNGREIAIFGKKGPFLGPFFYYLGLWGGLGGWVWSDIARGHCYMYLKGSRQVSSGSVFLTEFDP